MFMFLGLVLELLCLKPLLTIIQLYSWWRKPEYPEKTTDLCKSWQTLSHNVVSSTPCVREFELKTLVVIGTDWIGSFKSNYRTIMTTMAPMFLESEWLLFNSAIFQLYRGENKLIFNEMMMRYALC